MSTPRERVIKRLNRDFPKLVGCEIPIDQPIKSHQTMFADSGGYRWYFVYNSKAKDSVSQGRINAFGSTLTMTELLKGNKEWVVIREDHNCYDIQLREWHENELHRDSIFQRELQK